MAKKKIAKKPVKKSAVKTKRPAKPGTAKKPAKPSAKAAKTKRPAKAAKPAAKRKPVPAKRPVAKKAVGKTARPASKPAAAKSTKRPPVASKTKAVKAPAAAKPKAAPAPKVSKAKAPVSPKAPAPATPPPPKPAAATVPAAKPAERRPLKERVVMEFAVHSAPNVLYELISSPSGFSEWYCDDVDVRGDQFTFKWGNDEEPTTMIGRKAPEVVRFRRNEDEDQASFFEFRIRIDDMTNEVALIVTDHAWPKDVESTRQLWTSQIANLVRVLGA